MFRPPLALRDS
ncbi:hypothetical protein V6N13_039250 [Hibiscus sabdariffa]